MWQYHAGSPGWCWLPVAHVCRSAGPSRQARKSYSQGRKKTHQLYFSPLHGCHFCLPLCNPASFQFPVHTSALVSPLGECSYPHHPSHFFTEPTLQYWAPSPGGLGWLGQVPVCSPEALNMDHLSSRAELQSLILYILLLEYEQMEGRDYHILFIL